MKRVFLIVLDSVGVGELPDAHNFGDEGSNTLKSCFESGKMNIPNLTNLGIFNIDGVDYGKKLGRASGCFGKMCEKSNGKDTTIGHWEIAGVVSEKPLPTYPNGFPNEIIEQFEKMTGKKVICNKPYSGTKVIEDYGDEHIKTGNLIVYTSADSVFQIASHEDVVPLDKLYQYCEIARNMLDVGRVIARPFTTKDGKFVRTSNRHDYSLSPPKHTMLDILQKNSLSSIGIGKIYDIFNGVGVDNRVPTVNNDDGMDKTINIVKNKDFEGLCFVNLVDFDMLYGHRNDIDGYADALTRFDVRLGELMENLKDDDILILTADHGCDPKTPSTDHSREYVPILVYGNKIKENINLGVRNSFCDISETVLDIFKLSCNMGKSFLKDILK